MDGLAIKVTPVDGDTVTYKLTPRIIVAFEQQFGKGMPKLLSEEMRIEHVFWLAWKAQQTNGVIVKPFGPDYLDTLVTAELDSDPSFGSTGTA